MEMKFQLELVQTRPNQKNQRKKVKRVKKAKKLARADFDLDQIWQTQNPTTKKNLRKPYFRLKRRSQAWWWKMLMCES